MIKVTNSNKVRIVQLLSSVQHCDPRACSTPGFPVLDYVLEFAQVHVQEG